MAHEPKPHGAFQEGGPASDEDAGVAAHLVKRLQAVKTAGGLQSHKMVRNLPSGGYVIAQDMGGLVKTFVVKPPTEPPQDEINPYAGVAKIDIPILYSGRVVTPIVRGTAPVKVHLTDTTLRRMAGYDDDKEVGSSEQDLLRFCVPYPPSLDDLKPRETGELTHTQYSAAHPTWWSAGMAEVVQIVSGFGIQDPEQLPENERVKLAIPESVRLKMGSEKEHINVRLPGYLGRPPLDGKIRFDYKFNKTHVVSFDSGNRPWLVQISRAGVYTMPLPMIPATTTETFKRWMGSDEEWSVQDEEVMHILERFGGIPSGESFPEKEADFQAWKRAGVIIEVCDAGDFYDHRGYATTCGWSVNTKGTEGFNTCYDYDDNGFGVGFSYKLRLNMGVADFDGKLPEGLSVDDPEESALLSKYLSGLHRQLRESSAKNLAIKYKLRREGAEKILERAQSSDGAADVDYWDNLELEPIAKHSGSITQVSKGAVFNPAKFEAAPQIKFPEPLAGGCISHDLGANVDAIGKAWPRCDTIVFGYYVEDELKVVKYFYDPRVVPANIEDDTEPCLDIGTYAAKSEGSIQGNFYTTDFDDRELLRNDGFVQTSKLVSVIGYYYVLPQPPYIISQRLSRWKDFTLSSVAIMDRTHGLDVGVCVPFLCRNALLHMTQRTESGGATTSSSHTVRLNDRQGYTVTHKYNEGEKKWDAKVQSADSPGEDSCSVFVDSGPWADVGEIVTQYMHMKGPPDVARPTASPSRPIPDKDTRTLKLSLSANALTVLTGEQVSTGYLSSSPSQYGLIFLRSATKNVCGKAEYSIVAEPFGGHTKWGHSRYVDDKSIPRFIGVINE